MNKLDLKIRDFLRTVIVIDTESTNLLVEEAEICEIGAASFEGKWITRSTLVKPHELIPFAASNKNNISRKMLAPFPYLEDSLERIDDIINPYTSEYLVAHNAKYDQALLIKEFDKNTRIKHLEDYNLRFQDRKWICTYRLVRHLFPKEEQHTDFSHSLNYLRYAFDLDLDENTGVHRAGDDALTCALLLEYICKYILDGFTDSELDTVDLGEVLYDLSNSPIIMSVMSFGKHKGEQLKDIPISYINWLITNHDSLDEQSPNYDTDFSASILTELERREQKD